MRTPHPIELEILEFSSYDLVIDARSPREYAEDHIPCALNLPVVNNDEYAEVGTLHRNDTHAAYLIGVQYSLANISRHIEEVISRVDPRGRILVYCFRGGKRSKLWSENLRTIGYRVDVLLGGWKAYRRWVRASLEQFPKQFSFRVLAGSTGCGKTRLLQALERAGCQVLDLEGLANHRGSLIGAVPGEKQPTQKWFDTLLLSKLRSFDTEKPVWVEAESKKIGNIQLPTCLHEAIGRANPLRLEAPMAERIKLWREDYPHFVTDPVSMVERLTPLKPLIGGEELQLWMDLAAQGEVDTLFERVMVAHYDPCYARSDRRSLPGLPTNPPLELSDLSAAALDAVAAKLASEAN